jgi:hypothetical protein
VPSPLVVKGDTTVTLDQNAMAAIGKVEAALKSYDPNELQRLWKVIEDLAVWQRTFEANYQSQQTQLSNDLALTKALIEKSEDRPPKSGNLLTRAKGMFKSDQYMVTVPALEAIIRAMRTLPQDCPTNTGETGKKCCGSQPTTALYCEDPAVQAITKTLSVMVGNPPTSENDFLKTLRQATPPDAAIDSKIKKWKGVILSYSRVGLH